MDNLIRFRFWRFFHIFHLNDTMILLKIYLTFLLLIPVVLILMASFDKVAYLIEDLFNLIANIISSKTAQFFYVVICLILIIVLWAK